MLAEERGTLLTGCICWPGWVCCLVGGFTEERNPGFFSRFEGVCCGIALDITIHSEFWWVIFSERWLCRIIFSKRRVNYVSKRSLYKSVY
jgi:hypothetical protein